MAGSFSEQIERHLARTRSQVEATVRLTVSEIGQRLVDRSPVRTGTFRANWQLGVDAPQAGVIAASGTAESPAPPPEPPAIEAGGRRFFWSNNIGYARELDRGLGGRPPLGLTKLAEIEFPSIVAAAAKAAGGGKA
jgi:hypothetical protein